MKYLFLYALLFLFLQAKGGPNDTVSIRTSAVCETCKEAIEHGLSFEKGVKSARLDLSTAVVHVIFNPSKTTPDKIRLALTGIGYDADSLKALPKAFNKLPDCCKVPGKH